MQSSPRLRGQLNSWYRHGTWFESGEQLNEWRELDSKFFLPEGTEWEILVYYRPRHFK
jgi:hypothetical protein